jgi:hypothetical protein
MEEENEKRYRYRVRKLRNRIFVYALIAAAAIFLSLLILSHPDIQKSFFHPWLIEKWKIISYITLLILVPTLALLPIMLEANFYPRVLSGPGKTPPGSNVSSNNPPGG